MTPPSTAGARPKPVTTVPVRPALQTPADTAKAMAQAERLAIQSDLAWVGDYNGAITGEVSERMVAAIKAFQKARGGKQTGVLNPQERGILAETAKRRQDNVGWKIVTDAGTGVAARRADQAGAAASQRRQWRQMELSHRHRPDPACRGARKPTPPPRSSPSRKRRSLPAARCDYTVVKPDFFVLSGMQGLKKFYVRGTFKGDEVRILTILYDQATEGTVEPVVIAMSSAFNPFPNGAPIAGPPPRKTVEYGTGIVVSGDGAIVADRQVTDGCLAIAIAGHGNADRVAEDKDHDLALLRIYGARGLKPLSLANGAAKSGVELTGIADPQNQGGGAAASSVKAIDHAGRQRQRSRAVAGAGAGLFGRRGARCRRQVRRHRAVEAGGGGGTGERRGRGAGGAGASRYRARLSQGQRRQCGRRIAGRQGVRGARDLRAEVGRECRRLRPSADERRLRRQRINRILGGEHLDGVMADTRKLDQPPIGGPAAGLRQRLCAHERARHDPRQRREVHVPDAVGAGRPEPDHGRDRWRHHRAGSRRRPTAGIGSIRPSAGSRSSATRARRRRVHRPQRRSWAVSLPVATTDGHSSVVMRGRDHKKKLGCGGLVLSLVALFFALPTRKLVFRKHYDVVSIQQAPEYQDPARLRAARAYAEPVAIVFLSERFALRTLSLTNVFRSFGETQVTVDDVLAGSGKCSLGVCFTGLSLDDVGELARRRPGYRVSVVRDLTLLAFRAHLAQVTDPKRRYIINFDRGPLFGAEGGHHSPIGGYLADEDLVLVLDVNRAFEPWLVKAERLFAAMDTLDDQKRRRGSARQ